MKECAVSEHVKTTAALRFTGIMEIKLDFIGHGHPILLKTTIFNRANIFSC